MTHPEWDFDSDIMPDDGWYWQDARLIQVERPDDERPFEVGCIDVFANAKSGDLAGSYIPIERFTHPDVAQAFSDRLTDDFAQTGRTPYQMEYFAQRAALKHADGEVAWRSAAPEEYDAFLDQAPPRLDAPPDPALDPLLATAYELGGVPGQSVPLDSGMFQAVEQTGIQSDVLQEPQNRGFYDANSQTHYWIGVFQPDPADADFCVTSILSVHRDPETHVPTAHLAPCADGDWDTAYEHAGQLIDVANEEGLDACLDAAHEMALTSLQSPIWDSERGIELDSPTAQHVAQQLEIDL